jgi:hypothetical protein
VLLRTGLQVAKMVRSPLEEQLNNFAISPGTMLASLALAQGKCASTARHTVPVSRRFAGMHAILPGGQVCVSFFLPILTHRFNHS